MTGTFFLLLAAFCCWAAAVTYQDAAALRERGIEAEGAVSETFSVDGEPRAVLTFVTRDGDAIRPPTHDYEAGDKPRIVYDPAEPLNFVDAESGPVLVLPAVMALLAVGAGALVGPSYSRRIDWREFA